MIAVAQPNKKKAILSRALKLGIKQGAPPAVVSWVQDHLKLPETDMRRMKRLYDKVMNETITAAETSELDSLMEACSAMDLLRARVLFGVAKGSAKRRGE